MKKRHLGKLFLLLSRPYLLWAGGSVSATLSDPLVVRGDSVILTLKAEGNSVKFPSIDSIGAYPVQSISKGQNISTINGRTTRSLTRQYTFTPAKSMAIPSYAIEVDGTVEHTNPVDLQVTAPQAASKNASVQLEMHLAKKEVYVGEPVQLDLIFKHTPNAKYAKVELSEPEVKSFWAKKLQGSKTGTENGYITQTFSYLLFPQEAGKFTIPATFAKLGSTAKKRRRNPAFNDPFFDNAFANDPFFSAFGGSRLQWKKLFSNQAELTVKALPGNLDIYGDFQIKAQVDRTTVAANKPVNLRIVIEGEGNLDDIKKFNIDIPNAVVYPDEPSVNAAVQAGTYRGSVIEKSAIVADSNYTIPSVSFSYFDKQTQSQKTIETDPIAITVTGGTVHKSSTALLEEKNTETGTSATDSNKSSNAKTDRIKGLFRDKTNWLYLAVILTVLIILGLLLSRKKGIKSKKAHKEVSIVDQILRAKDDKALLEILLPYANADHRVKETLDKLEKNLYSHDKEEIDKEYVLEYFEESV